MKHHPAKIARPFSEFRDVSATRSLRKPPNEVASFPKSMICRAVFGLIGCGTMF